MPTAVPRPMGVVPVALAAVSALLAEQETVPVPTAPAWESVVVRGITHDSRAVLPGDLYAALPGANAHGIAFADEAIRRGAVAILTDRTADTAAACVPVLHVADPRARMGEVASVVYGHPSRRLALYGVTGTNGKTTTAYLLDAGLRAAGHVTGLIGTVETRIGTEVLSSARTTPEATDLQALLAVMVERGVTACAMEVSSHALSLGRVDGCWFAAAGFTNLGRDHLDFHGDLESYFRAKATLFTPERTHVAVIDVTNPYGARLSADVRGVRVIEVGADIRASTAMLGAFNKRNAALALEMLIETGIDPVTAARGIAAMPGVPGRVERIDAGQPFTAVVDYAHTPDAVEALLQSLRPLTERNLLVVLGCGGDRDTGKRPVMGELAATLADRAFFTDDNPRSEPGARILAEMVAGVPAGRRDVVVVEPDRAAAIDLAVHAAGPGDVVVVAGKGHESGQDVGGVVTDFDDRVVLRDALERAMAGR